MKNFKWGIIRVLQKNGYTSEAKDYIILSDASEAVLHEKSGKASDDKRLIFLSISQLSFLCLASSVEIIQYLPFKQFNICSFFLLAGFDFIFQSLGIINNRMINIVSRFINWFQSKILQTLIFNEVSVYSTDFPEVNPCFPANAKHSKKTYDLQQSHQAIRCFYFVTIVTFIGDKFHRKFTLANQNTFQESFTRNNVKIIGIIVIFFLFLLLYASYLTSSRSTYFPNAWKFCSNLTNQNLIGFYAKKIPDLRKILEKQIHIVLSALGSKSGWYFWTEHIYASVFFLMSRI